MSDTTGRPASAAAAGSDAAGTDPRAVLASIGAATYDWDIASDRLTWSHNLRDLLGLAPGSEPATGAAFRRLVSKRSVAARDDALALVPTAAKPEGHPYTLRYELAVPAGRVAVEDSGRSFPGADGRPARLRGLMRIVGREAPGHAASPGGWPRAELLGRIGDAFAASRADNRSFGLIVTSISGLPTVQDSHGSEIADAVVEEVSRRVRATVRRQDLVLHYAPNRIAIFLARAAEEEIAAAARRIVERAGGAPVDTAIGAIPVRLIAGGISGPRFARDARILLRRAEEAHDRARRSGKDFVAYEPDRASEMRRAREQALSDEVLKALRDGRLVIARQPVITPFDRRVAFHEALLRLVTTDGRVVSAASIVPTFEKLGRIELLDTRVLDLALEALAREPGLSLSVNVAVATLRSEAWMGRLADALRPRPDIAARLIVELTESQSIEDEAGTQRAFAAIKALGARTAIDDFGAGYTSFKHLRGLGVDILKIDGAFVQNIRRSADDGFFVRTLISLGRHLGMQTVAEWVTDEESVALLADWGIDLLQGDFLAPAEIVATPAHPALRVVA